MFNKTKKNKANKKSQKKLVLDLQCLPPKGPTRSKARWLRPPWTFPIALVLRWNLPLSRG